MIITLNIINKFIQERQPNKKIELANIIKQNKELYAAIMQHTKININNCIYYYNITKNKYM